MSVAVLLFALIVPVVQAHAQAVAVDSTTAAQPADTLAVGVEPYRSERTALEYVLAAPSLLLHAVTRPIGWGVRWLAEHFPRIFEGELPIAGAYPLIESSQEVGLALGASAYHRNLFGRGHRVEARVLFGSRFYNETAFSYEVPGVLGFGTAIGGEGYYRNDPHEPFFPEGNTATPGDRRFYAIEEGAAAVNLRLSDRSIPRGLGGVLRLRYRQVRVAPEDDAEPPPLPPTLRRDDVTRFLTAGISAVLEGRRGLPRAQGGGRLGMGWSYHHALGAPYRFWQYHIDYAQVIRPPFLPPGRRFVLRGLLEKVAASTGEVPFYLLPTLGGAETLRGYRSGRFRDEGALLFNVEYRYPVWENLDAVFFVDAGQVFDGYGDLAFDRFHWNAGAGFRLLTDDRLAFRLELAVGPDYARTIITVAPLF